MTASTTEKFNWPLLLIFWAVIAAAISVRTLFGTDLGPLIADTDDAMRMVRVHDLLAGQNWFDPIQHRLNTPFGAVIHWSRLTDVPIAVLIFVLTPLVGGQADIIAAYASPLLLLLVLMILSAKLSVKFAGPEGLLPGIVLPILSAALLPEFSPGRLDHHNVQILLVLAITLSILNTWDNARWAIASGILAVTALAIGTESLPVVVGAIMVMGCYWVADPDRGQALRWFGLSFGLGALVHLGLALPPDQWMLAACDIFSATYFTAALGTGILFVLLSALPLGTRPWPVRLGIGIVAAAALCAVLVALFPSCLNGPYAALDPWLRNNWISNIVEARPIWTSVKNLPAITLSLALPPLVALIVTAWQIVRGDPDTRASWLVLGLFLLLTIIVMVLQVRGARLVAPLAIPAGAWLICAVRQRYLASNKLADAGLLIMSWLAFSGVLVVVAGGYLFGSASPSQPVNNREAKMSVTISNCLRPAAFTKLAGMPVQSIMAPADLGSHLLLFTPHEVVAAPYHRNGEGMLATFRFFNRSIEEARGILRARDIRTIVVCPVMPEVIGFADASPQSFARLLADDNLPVWLQRTSAVEDVLQVYELVD